MSQETAEWLNNMTLIGCTDQRGMAWHWREGYQGEESNHYPGPIPVSHLKRRLFNWQPIKAQSAGLAPVDMVEDETNLQFDENGELHGALVPDLSQCNAFDANGDPLRDSKGNICRLAVSESRVMIVRSDNLLDLGAFKSGYEPHDYNEWLVKVLSNLLGDTLVISSAGLLRLGAQAWVEASFPESAHDSETGLDYRPNLLTTTSLDGSLATGYFGTTTLTVCDNTMNMAMAGAGDRKYKVKHSKYSGLKLEDARESLNILHQQNEQTVEELHKWARINLSPKNWVDFMEIIVPSPVDEKESKRAYTMALRKREELNHVYHNDPMGAAEHKGTALGALRAANTWFSRYGDIRGASRNQRHNERMVKGEFADFDIAAVEAIAQVLDKPELVTVN